ncbi:hypothetical protein DOT_1985 [Desulfosporosinus sp. OT]|nr:hypothetical protein DOT_1985 [Desulfosporosinus sp. OT]
MVIETSNVGTALQPNQPNPLSPVIPVNFKPTDSLVDPNRPVIYLTDNTNRRIYAVNYKTLTVSFIQVDLPPERMAFANNELYVTLMQRGNQNSLSQESTGKVGIIDANSFNLTKEIPLNMIPDDIAIEGGNIYIAAYTKDGIKINSFSCSTGQIVDKTTQISEAYTSNVNLNNSHLYYPGERLLDSQGFPRLIVSGDKLYLIEEDLYSRSILNVYVYNVTNSIWSFS